MRDDQPVTKIDDGLLEDLTFKFYSSPTNLKDEDYYENVGRSE
jgi:hypothetical protein